MLQGPEAPQPNPPAGLMEAVHSECPSMCCSYCHWLTVLSLSPSPCFLGILEPLSTCACPRAHPGLPCHSLPTAPHPQAPGTSWTFAQKPLRESLPRAGVPWCMLGPQPFLPTSIPGPKVEPTSSWRWGHHPALPRQEEHPEPELPENRALQPHPGGLARPSCPGLMTWSCACVLAGTAASGAGGCCTL